MFLLLYIFGEKKWQKNYAGTYYNILADFEFTFRNQTADMVLYSCIEIDGLSKANIGGI